MSFISFSNSIINPRMTHIQCYISTIKFAKTDFYMEIYPIFRYFHNLQLNFIDLSTS